MRILTLDAALAHSAAGVVVDGAERAVCAEDGREGQATRLPVMAERVLDQAGLLASELDLVAVTVGPGSFTGIRAALALAHGLAAALAIPVVGVTVGEAFGALAPAGSGVVWAAIDNRRGRVFLDRGGNVAAFALDELPAPDRPVTIGGDAAAEAAARLGQRGHPVRVSDARFPSPRGIATAALRRIQGAIPPLPALPLYVDPPAVRPNPAGLRPPPQR
jgi:tRNA threonylcarbamoyl adenosine modification protein YeaZ